MKRSLESPELKEAKRLKPCPEISAVTASSEWKGGSSQRITWNSEGDVRAVSLVLCKSTDSIIAGYGANLDDEIANTGSSVVTVPRGYLPGVYHVRVQSAVSRRVHSYSGPITLDRDCVPPKILDVMSTSAVWEGGAVGSVTWSHQGDVPTVNLLLCKAREGDLVNEYAIGDELHWDIANTNSSCFAVPTGMIPGGYHVRVESTACRLVAAHSGLIQIDQGGTPPAILDVATDDADWESGTLRQVTWRHQGEVSAVIVCLVQKFSLFGDLNAALVDILAHDVPNSGSYSITVPAGLPPGAYGVRVASSASDKIYAINWEIRIDHGHTPPAISDVTASQQIWHSGSRQILSWNSQGHVSLVKIHLMRREDFFGIPHDVYVETLETSLPNTGSCSITVPTGLLSDTYHIKIESSSSSEVKASSADILIDDEHRERCVRYALGLLGLRRPRRLPYSVVKKIAVMAATE